jgi:hypothetical protein
MSKIELLRNSINTHFNKLASLYDTLGDNDDTFYIYTTGIASWTQKNLINIWEECRYNNIIRQIPDKFKNIVIKHYDPIIEVDNKENIKNIIIYIKEVLNKQDTDSKTDKKTSQIFIKEFFDYTKINTTQHYIILDFALLFNYCYDNTGYYIMSSDKTIIKNLNCINIPYPTDCNSFWEKMKYFNYDNNKFTSYIELFFKVLFNNTKYTNIMNTTQLYKINKDIIIYSHPEDINIILNKILYEGELYNYVKTDIKIKTGSITIPLDIYVYLDNNIKNKLFVDFFDKLLGSISDNDLLFNIQNYTVINEVKKN